MKNTLKLGNKGMKNTLKLGNKGRLFGFSTLAEFYG
jgi:hypothetical protein